MLVEILSVIVVIESIILVILYIKHQRLLKDNIELRLETMKSRREIIEEKYRNKSINDLITDSNKRSES